MTSEEKELFKAIYREIRYLWYEIDELYPARRQAMQNFDYSEDKTKFCMENIKRLTELEEKLLEALHENS